MSTAVPGEFCLASVFIDFKGLKKSTQGLTGVFLFLLSPVFVMHLSKWLKKKFLLGFTNKFSLINYAKNFDSSNKLL